MDINACAHENVVDMRIAGKCSAQVFDIGPAYDFQVGDGELALCGGDDDAFAAEEEDSLSRHSRRV
jgi:hypothetical protein